MRVGLDVVLVLAMLGCSALILSGWASGFAAALWALQIGLGVAIIVRAVRRSGQASVTE